MNHKEMKLLD